MITSKDFVQRLQTRPFEPFRVVTSSGQAYEITHPELLMVERRYLIIGAPSAQYPGQIDRFNQVSMLHISDVQSLADPAMAGANGSMS